MTTLPLADVRANLSKLVDAAATTHQRVEVTRRGRREAVLLGAADYDSLIETLEILADEAAVAGLVEARREVADGVWFDADDVTEAMRRAGRL
ncbi:MAG: type II toxin-antitoxin system Phd/YefM family antitoxin [Bifidobacteriaceae bacterium]|jgi:prevent-host-death family protein|nr:type II toxin-antitoxin system Phd/YefM family antitoxin [Bifidobacteriaceae bacterium]